MRNVRKTGFILGLAVVGLVWAIVTIQGGDGRMDVEGSSHLDVKEQLEEYITAHKIPGLQVSIISHGYDTDTRVDITVGTSAPGSAEKIDGEHVFRLGSVTKFYTATIIMKLIEEERMSLDATIDKWFPDIPNASSITVKQLLNHTSGIHDYTSSRRLQIGALLRSHATWSPEELYTYVRNSRPDFAPGERHLYSNSNYLLLGLIAQKVAEKPYATLLDEMILTPLKLSHTWLLPQAKTPPKQVHGYDRDYTGLGLYTHTIRNDNTAWASIAFSAGGIAATGGDLRCFVDALFTDKVLKPSTLEMMKECVSCTDEGVPDQTGYGLALRRLVILDDTLLCHTGTIPGFGCAAFHCAERGYTVVFAGNYSAITQGDIFRILIREISGP